MVTWDDSPYKEFAYYETNANGAIKDFMNFRVAFPEDYDKNSSKKYPAIVMLHGAGESGRAWAGHYQYTPSDPEYDNNGRHMLFGALEHLFAIRRASSHPRSFPGIVIFPQVSANGAWVGGNIEKATKILEYMIEEYHVDPFRIFIHGLSNGGKGVWEFSTQRPDLFSAALPMSGVGTDLDVMTDLLVTMPIWLFQGELDKNPSQGWSKQWINALKAKGGKPRYTIYENTGHGTWKKAYAEDDFFSWILQHDKRQVYFFADETHVPAPDAPLMLGFSAGFLGYQWTRNGVDIPGATGRYYTATMEGAYAVKFKQRLGGQSWVESFELDLSDPAQCSVNGQPGLQVRGHAYLPLPEEESVDHTLSLEAEEGFSKYRWFRNGELLAETSENALLLNNASGSQFKAVDAGIYTVVVENENGCLSSFSQPVQIQWVDPGAEVETFVPYLHARGTVDLPLPDSIADKSLVLFGSPGFPSYRWYKDGKLIEGEHSDRLELNDEAGALFQPDDAGVYTFEVINEAGSRSQPSAGISVSFETLDEFIPVLLAKGLTDFPLADSIQDKSLTLVAPGGFAYYRWYKNDTLILESADSMLMLNNVAGTSFKKQDAGKYSVVVGRAGAYPSRYSNGIVVTFEDLSDFVPQLVAEGATELPLPTHIADKSLKLIAPQGYSKYKWYRDNLLIMEGSEFWLTLNDVAGKLFTADNAGAYYVVVSDRTGASSLPSNSIEVAYTAGQQPQQQPEELLLAWGAVVPGSSAVLLEWVDLSSEVSYEIWRARKNTFSNSGAKTAGYPEEPLQQIAVVAADNTSYVDQFLRPGAEYVYFVKALAPEGKYTESETSAVLLPQDTTQPTAPRNLQVTSRTESEIGLEWTPSTDDDVVFRYEIFVDDEKVAELMAEVPAEDGDPTDGNPGPETKFVLENLQPRTAYAIKVRALDYQGNDFQGNTSDFSNTVTTSVILGINEPEVASQPLAYPNPFSREVSIRFPEPVERGRRVMVYDHAGSLVLTTLTETTAAVVAVDLSEVPDGLYILTLENFTFRLIKRN